MLVLCWNLGEAGALFSSGGTDTPLNELWPGRLARQLGLDQRWAMFAPNPQTEDGTFEVIAVRAQSQIDVLPGLIGAPGIERPLSTNQRWLLFFLELEARPSPGQLAGLGAYVCRTDPAIEAVAITFTQFDHLRDGTRSPPVRSELWRGSCGAQ